MKKSGKVAIVTGAAHGIGEATALRLVEKGWRVVAADRNEAALAALAKKKLIHGVAADVTSELDLRDLVEATMERYGRLDAVVSNAGVSEFKPLPKLSLEGWNRVIATNLTPGFLLAREAEAALRAAKGSMVLISSTRATMSEPDTLAYSATKGALVSLTHSLAISLAPDVRVNCISPGWIDVSGEKLSAKDHAQHPVGRVGVPEDIAAAVDYLIGEDAGFITGAEWIIDGGMTRKMIYV